MYTAFAGVYDLLMADVDYGAWARRYARLLEARGVRPGSAVCECACGTGSLTIPLQTLGFEMTGADLSGEMLQAAGEKARQAGLRIPFVRQDMRELTLHRSADAVLATCDGVNYLLTDGDLRAFLRAVHRCLRPGGCLIFDVSTPWKLENDLGNRLLCEDRPEAVFMWQNTWRPRKRLVDMRLCVFRREADGRYSRVDEAQTQRAWSREELETLLRENGFADVLFEGDREEAPRPRDRRWHVSAVREA